MSKAKTIELVNDKDIQKVLLRIFISILIILSVTYVYLIDSITFNVLARKTLESTSHELGSRVSELELTYLNNANKIDKSYAATLGFVDAKDSIFTTRTTTRVAIR